MFQPGQPLGVAVSGGADSVALLHLLLEQPFRLRHPLSPPLPLTVLHLDHRLRGPESDQDARFVQDLAARLGLPCLLEQASLPSGGNLEEAARQARYAFFARAMREHGLARVAVGHTRSDQAETLLFRLLRGAGITGLAGIWPVTPEGIVRPLIDVTRDQVIVWLRERGIAWREDSSNRDPRFARNRIRHHLLPALRRDWNPNLDAALARLAEVCQDEERYWQETAAALLGSVAVRRDAALVLDLGRLTALPVAAMRRLLREAVIAVRADPRPLEFQHLESVVDLVRGIRRSGRLLLPGLEVCRSFHLLRLAPAGLSARPYDLELPVPGEVRLPDGLLFAATLDPQAPDSRYNTSAGVLDRDRAPGKLTLRSWTPGVTFWPAGQPQATKLKFLFQRARVPSWERPEWPILQYRDSVIWARGFGPAQGFAATGSTRNVIRLWESVR